MKDIDFDELDRAVNSLMSGVPKAEPAKEDDVKTLAFPSPAPKNETTFQSEHAQSAPASASSEPDNETPKAAERSMSAATIVPVAPAMRRGRFMDMVRPAADTKQTVPSRPVSRHTGTIEPSRGFTLSPSPSATGRQLPAQNVPVPQDPSPSSDWPDPLSAIDFDKTTAAVEDKAPLTSPFLPDAKVEKRPLGRASDDNSFSGAASEPDHAPVLGALASSESGEAEVRGDTAIPQQPLPAELGQDVMAIEADTSGMTPEVSVESAVEFKTPPVRPSAPSPVPAISRPAVTSIPQQYKVQPKVADPSPGAIYDTATYHQPLTHPAKKKPGWLWVIAIILILLLGAASGAAVYFYGLI